MRSLLTLLLCLTLCASADAQLFGRRAFSNSFSSCANGNCSNGSCSYDSYGLDAVMSSFNAQPLQVSRPSSVLTASTLTADAAVTADGYVVNPETGRVITELYGVPICTRSFMETRVSEARAPIAPVPVTPPLTPLAPFGAAPSCPDCVCTCDCGPQLKALADKIEDLTDEVKNLKHFYNKQPEAPVAPAPEAPNQSSLRSEIEAMVARQAADRANILARISNEGAMVAK